MAEVQLESLALANELLKVVGSSDGLLGLV
jgi:hypothetical protein